MTDSPSPRPSPLHDIHVAAGASFTDFAGWLMPVSYGSDLAEHRAVRTTAGIFDISHMAEFRITGPDAAAFLDFALAGLISAVPVGRAKYSLVLAESGGIVDDVIVYHDRPGEYFLVANAGNRGAVASALAARAHGFDTAVTDLTDELVLIAVQGPNAREILEVTTNLEVDSLPELKYYACAAGRFLGHPILVARTGYTGEDGYELYVPVADSAALWAALLDGGAPLGLIAAGLASRDTLRLEAGMPLYGHELTLATQPVQAGLGRVVNTTKDFVGRSAIERGPGLDGRVLVGLTLDGKRAGRAGYPVLQDGVVVGEVTSGALSPTLGFPIAMAYVDAAAGTEGAHLAVDVRGTAIAASVVPLPFYRRATPPVTPATPTPENSTATTPQTPGEAR